MNEWIYLDRLPSFFSEKNRKSKFFSKCARKMKGRTPVNPLPKVFNLKWKPKLVRKNPIRGCLTINFHDSIILSTIYRLVRNFCWSSLIVTFRLSYLSF